jgi:hypothetical protein
MKIDKGTQLISKPGKRDLILATPYLELLNASISEIHGGSGAQPSGDLPPGLCKCGLHQRTLLLLMDTCRPD